jgi:hypothetical protein
LAALGTTSVTSHGNVKRGGVVPLRPSLLLVKTKGLWNAGSFDGAKVCKLVELFILNTLEKRFGKDVGLYRDDGLAALRTTAGRLWDKARKELTTIFEIFGHRITAQTKIKCVKFLDLMLDLSSGKYKPYRKPNDEPLHINRLTNHPPSITRQLPHSVNKRINKLSCDEEAFNGAAPLYNTTLSNKAALALT